MSRLAFCRAGGLSDFDVDHQTVTILHQRMTQESQLRLVAFALFVQPGVGIGRRSMSIVTTLLALEIDCRVTTAIFRWRARTVFLYKAFMRGLGLNQRTIDREMLVRKQLFPLRQGQNPLEKQTADMLVQQTVSVGTESRVIPYLVIHRQTDEPAVQQVEVDVLTNCRSERMENNTCNKLARNKRSGGMESRPRRAYSVSNSPLSVTSSRSTTFRNLRSGCFFGIRSSRVRKLNSSS